MLIALMQASPQRAFIRFNVVKCSDAVSIINPKRNKKLSQHKVYTNMKHDVYLKWGKHISKFVKIIAGVRQGGGLSVINS